MNYILIEEDSNNPTHNIIEVNGARYSVVKGLEQETADEIIRNTTT
jgi:hypothetical protein